MENFHLFVIGCQMNQADAERLRAYLSGLGLREVAQAADADLVVLITCGVRQTAEDRVYTLAFNLKQAKPDSRIVLTGCLALRPDVRERLADSVDYWLPISQLNELGSWLGLAEHPSGSLSYLSIQPQYTSTFSAFVPIGNGCDNFCSYCVVPYARGREVYRPQSEIINEVKNLLVRGYREITLIAQNVNSYRDVDSSRGGDFADLLSAVDQLPGDWWLRFATSHPKDLSEKLIATVAGGRHACQHFHVALQSGDDEILRRMNRRYTAEHFLNLIDTIRRYSPQAAISTDIIVGFPGETEAQFENTAAVMRQAAFDMAYIAQYSPRPGTAAAKLNDDVPRAVKKRRQDLLEAILRQSALDNAQRYLGATVQVLADRSLMKQGNPRLVGKTAEFKTVSFSSMAPVGGFYQVLIEEVDSFGLRGRLLN